MESSRRGLCFVTKYDFCPLFGSSLKLQRGKILRMKLLLSGEIYRCSQNGIFRYSRILIWDLCRDILWHKMSLFCLCISLDTVNKTIHIWCSSRYTWSCFFSVRSWPCLKENYDTLIRQKPIRHLSFLVFLASLFWFCARRIMRDVICLLFLVMMFAWVINFNSLFNLF